MRTRFIIPWAAAVLLCLAGLARAQQAHGAVYLDANRNGLRDAGERGIPGVCVSNGREVVRTDRQGAWSLPVTDDTALFVIKPAGYAVPVDGQQLPRFYYLHKPQGSPPLDVPGVAPTGPLPKSVDFPLYRQRESERFSVLFFGDTQTRGLREVNFMSHDVVEECIGTDAAFGVTLGDLTADGPPLFEEIAARIAQVGIPWWNVIGNHDGNRAAVDNRYKDDSYERVFGPSTYAFEHGKVAFIGLNDIFYEPGGRSVTAFTDDQLAFVKNYLALVPPDRLVVLMMHAPIIGAKNREAMYRLIEGRPHCFSISSHAHQMANVFIDKGMGWQGKQPHHHFIDAAVSGSWWCGGVDEVGIPHATMNDGAPNGYAVATFDGNRYSLRFKAARRPADYQMNIYLPDEVEQAQAGQTPVLVNAFAGSERSKVELRLDDGPWQPLGMTAAVDPECLRMHELTPYLEQTVLGKPLEEVFGWPMDYPSKSRHMWQGNLPPYPPHGTHTVTVRTVDMFGQTWTGHRVLRVR